MINFSKVILSTILLTTVISCSPILEPVQLKLNTKDGSIQEKFNVIEKTLTIQEARKQSKSFFNRMVLQTGRGEKARTLPESVALQSNFPESSQPPEFRVSIGDRLSLSRLIENSGSGSKSENQWPNELINSSYKLGIGDTLILTLLRDESQKSSLKSNDNGDYLRVPTDSSSESTIVSTGRIGSDGSVLLLEVGRLEANGKSLNELRSEVRNILIRKGISPRFQLEIRDFKSQKAYLTVNQTSQTIVLDDQKTTLKDVLTSAKVGFKPGTITRIRLQRNGREYLISLRSIFNENSVQVGIRALDHIFVEDSAAEVVKETSTVGHDENILFAGVGSINVVGLSFAEIKTKISSLIEKLPDSDNAFQVELVETFSKKATINLPEEKGGVIPISDTPILLEHVLTERGLSVKGEAITRISLQREGKTYIFTLHDLLTVASQKIYLRPNDLVTTEILSYKEDKVFILGGVSPKIYKIKPSSRQTLADVLFTAGGVLSNSGARRSEVYLLRGDNPVVAYHLDAQSPTRLIVADTMELRPNDILYVSEQPIISFNRTLSTIVPLRVLLRDIQDQNLP